MNRKIWIGTLSAALLFGGAAVTAGQVNGDSADSKAGMNNITQAGQKYITVEQAKTAALKAVKGHVEDVDLERKQGKVYYEVEVEQAGGHDIDVRVDAVSGKVLAVLDRDMDDEDDRDRNHDSKNPSAKAKITSKQASDIAVKTVSGGKVIRVKLDEDDNRYIYEVKLTTSKGKAEVDIDAVTGKVLSVDHDFNDAHDHDDHDED